MITNLAVNPELYVLAFTTSDAMRFDLIKNGVKNIPSSKKRFIFSNGKDNLFVDRNYYEKVIDVGLEFLRLNNSEKGIDWVNKSGVFVPCGYYQVAVAIPLTTEKQKEASEIDNFKNLMLEKINKPIYFSHDYLSNTYNICLYGRDYNKSVSSFNKFILENGKGPFDKIEVVSCYGSKERKEFPLLKKRK